MKKIKLEHIDVLSKGKKSGINLGSRIVPHHLYKYEREEYERSLKRWYLILDKTSRPNLENLWKLVSLAYQRDCIILHKINDRWYVTLNWITVFEGILSDAKIYVKNL